MEAAAGESSCFRGRSELRRAVPLPTDPRESAGRSAGFVARWERQVVPLGGPPTTDLGARPEWACYQYAEPIKVALAWYGEVWRPLEEAFKREGLHWNTLLTAIPRNLAPHDELLRLRDAVLDHLPSILAARAKHLRWEHVGREFADLSSYLASVGRDDSSAQVVRRLREAVARHDATAYREAFERLTELHNRQAHRALRRELLRRMEASAPAWAANLRDRRAPMMARRHLVMSPQLGSGATPRRARGT
jgi:hypothetical protein